MNFNFKQQFDEFCNENSLVKLQKTTHDIDRNALLSWKENMIKTMNFRFNNDLDDETTYNTIMEWIKRFSVQLTSISIATFETTLNSVVYDIQNFVKEQQQQPVVLYLDSKDIRKSNVWISILAWNEIKKTITHVCDLNGILQLFDKHTIMQIILFDDAAYTGSQISSKLKLLQKKFERATFCIGIPYISREARILIEENRGVFFPASSISFSPLYNVTFDYDAKKSPELALLQLSGPSAEFWSEYFGYKKRQRIRNAHAIFFNHKLGDYLSSYPQIIVWAPVPPVNSNDIEMATLSTRALITNCCNFIKYDSNVANAEQLSKNDAACPVPIYKTFLFKFRGHEIIENNLFRLFMETCTTCKRISNKIYACSGKGCAALYCSTACADEHWYFKGHYKKCFV